MLRAKAVLCPGLTVKLQNESGNEKIRLVIMKTVSVTYLSEALVDTELLPQLPFMGSRAGEHEAVDWAIHWLPEEGELITESYVNLVPTPQGGTHVNGLRQGLLEAMREFCESRNLLPRGRSNFRRRYLGALFISPLGKNGPNPQFAGQTKERLSSRECSTFVSGVVHDTFSQWLHQHVEMGERIAELVISQCAKTFKER